jgi:hypothetical protein
MSEHRARELCLRLRVPAGREREVRSAAERFTRAVVVTYNLLSVTADAIRYLITAAGFAVGQPERASRVGQQIIIPQDSVE